MKKPLYVIIFIVFFSLISQAKKPTTNIQELEAAFNFLSKNTAVEFKIEKTTVSEIMSKKSVSGGRMVVTQGKFRIDLEKPIKTEFVFDGNYVWNMQHPPAELGGKPEVQKIKVKPQMKDQVLVRLLSGKKISQHFKIKTQSLSEGMKKFEIAAISKDPQLSEISIFLDEKSKALKKIEYSDDVKNRVTYSFLERKKVKLTSKLFVLDIPKNVKVDLL